MPASGLLQSNRRSLFRRRAARAQAAPSLFHRAMAAAPDFKIRALKLTEEAELPSLVPDEAKATLHPHYEVRERVLAQRRAACSSNSAAALGRLFRKTVSSRAQPFRLAAPPRRPQEISDAIEATQRSVASISVLMRGVLIAQIALLVLVVVLPLVVALVGWIGTGFPFGAYAGNIVAIVLGIMVSAVPRRARGHGSARARATWNNQLPQLQRPCFPSWRRPRRPLSGSCT